MPIIHIELGQGQVDQQQKQQLIERFTHEAVSITGIGEEKFTTLIHELPLENIGLGGKTLKNIRLGR